MATVRLCLVTGEYFDPQRIFPCLGKLVVVYRREMFSGSCLCSAGRLWQLPDCVCDGGVL